MKLLIGAELKAYFRVSGRVVSWWRPETGAYRFWHKHEFTILDRYVPTNTTSLVLDAACGQGRFARHFAHRGCSVYGMDINKEMLVVAREKALEQNLTDRITYIEGDIEAPLITKHTAFDVIVCMDALDHMTDINCAITNLVSVLKKGGVLAITYTSSESFYGILRKLYTFLAYRNKNAECDIGNLYSFSVIKKILEIAGITITHVVGIGLLTAPQERIRLPLGIDKFFLFLSRAELAVRSIHTQKYFSRHCSVITVIGRKL